MKVKQFSHNDLDGVGAVVVGKRAFGDSLSYECCSYGNVNDKVKEFLLSPELDTTDVIFITDISVNDPEVIALIEEKAKDKLMLLDHHGTAEALNYYNWAQVSEYENTETGEIDEKDSAYSRLASGTSLFYFYLVNNGLLNDTQELRDFVEQVRCYDSWDWDRQTPKNETAYQLNSLHVMIGRWKFIDRFAKNPEVLFNETERALLDVEKKRIESTIFFKRKSLMRKKLKLRYDSFDVGIVFADNYHSELGNVLAKENPDLDFIILINGGTRLSFRGVEKGIDLGQIAGEFKTMEVATTGGGHPLAAGAELSLKIQESMIDAIFSKLI